MTVKEQPFVSVVVCAFNEQKLLGQCLDGLLALDYPRDLYEVIVVDDESTDNTFAIASAFIAGLGADSPRFRLVRIEHGGLSVARNSGIRLSEGSVIAFIDGDAVPARRWLDELAKPFMAGADYVGGRIDLLNGDSWVARLLQRTRNRQFFGPKIFNDNLIGCNMAYRRGVLDEAGGFHENFISRGDESTLVARIRHKFTYAPAPDAIVLHERPESLMVFAKVEWKSATLTHLGARAAGGRRSIKQSVLYLEQWAFMLTPLFLVLFALNPGLFAIPLLTGLCSAVHRLYLRPYSRAVAMGLIEHYGMFRGLFGHAVYTYAYNAIFVVGRFLSPWIHGGATIIPPMATPLNVKSSVENKPGCV